MIKEYDPNIRWARHTFELTFMQWDYSLKVEVEVQGNYKGADLFASAIQTYFDDIYDDDEMNAQIVLKRPAEDGTGEDTLEINLEGDDDLMDICVSACITKHVREEQS